MDHELPQDDLLQDDLVPDANPEPAIDDAVAPDEPRSAPPPDVPVAGDERIRTLDLLRGVAVLGIFAINVWTFALPYPAALNPSLAGYDGAADRVVHLLVHMLVLHKTMPIFSMLFGAGILLFTSRVEARGGRSGRRWFSRQGWLLVIGLVHGYLLWNGDILAPYAFVGLVLYRLRRLRPRVLLVLAVLLMLGPKLTTFGLGAGMEYVHEQALLADAAEEAGDEPTDGQERLREMWRNMSEDWNPDAAQIAEGAAEMRGDWGTVVARNARELLVMHLTMYPFLVNWDLAGLMLLGMALFKTGVLQGQRTDRFYLALAAVSYGVGLPCAWWSFRFLDAHFADLPTMLRGGFPVLEAGGTLVALGHIALIVLLARHRRLGPLEPRLAAAGRMAFTNYLSQTVVGVTLFYGYGFGLYGRLDRVEMMGVTLAVWIVQLAWSPWWLARFRFGPAEWLWRSLTYGRRQPLRRGTGTGVPVPAPQAE